MRRISMLLFLLALPLENRYTYKLYIVFENFQSVGDITYVGMKLFSAFSVLVWLRTSPLRRRLIEGTRTILLSNKSIKKQHGAIASNGVLQPYGCITL